MKLALFSLAFFPALAFAQEADPNLNQIVDAVFQAFSTGKIVVGVAGIVLALVFLFRKYLLPKLGLGNGVLPYLSLGLGVLVSVCTAILGGMSPAQAATSVMFSGPMAMTLWDSFFKLMAKKD